LPKRFSGEAFRTFSRGKLQPGGISLAGGVHITLEADITAQR
jgi:hypothetical protein